MDFICCGHNMCVIENKSSERSGSYGNVTLTYEHAIKSMPYVEHPDHPDPIHVSTMREIVASGRFKHLRGLATVKDIRVHKDGAVAVYTERAPLTLLDLTVCAATSPLIGMSTPNTTIPLDYLFWSLMTAVRTINRVGMMHRDIKPGNILLFPSRSARYPNLPRIELCDFGSCRFIPTDLYMNTTKPKTTAAITATATTAT